MKKKIAAACMLYGARAYATIERTKEIRAIISSQRFILLAVK